MFLIKLFILRIHSKLFMCRGHLQGPSHLNDYKRKLHSNLILYEYTSMTVELIMKSFLLKCT